MFYRLALIICLVCGLGSALAASEELAATVLRTTGKGKVVLPGGGAGEFKAGTLLRAGSRVITEESSLAVLVLEDGSRVNVGPNTDLTIAELNRDGAKNSTVFELLRGIFKASVQKLTVGSRFEVKTSDAVAAVKGTEYEVEVTDAGTDARVKEGTVWLEDPKREHQVIIHEHMTARAGHHGDLGESREMRRDEAERFGAWRRADDA